MKSNQYFYIAALPKLSESFYKKIRELHGFDCHPEFRLPFHVTLFYLDRLTEDQADSVNAFLTDYKVSLENMTATVKGVNSFQQDGEPFVYFLELESQVLNTINQDFSKKFSDIHKDQFNFIPHLSLFFPKFPLGSKNKSELEKLFSRMQTLEFEGLSLVSSIDNIAHIHKTYY